jgi:hypothetical protein
MPDYESFNTDDDGKKDEAYDEPVALYDLMFVAESGLTGYIYKVTKVVADKWEKSILKAYPTADIKRRDHDGEADPTDFR